LKEKDNKVVDSILKHRVWEKLKELLKINDSYLYISIISSPFVLKVG